MIRQGHLGTVEAIGVAATIVGTNIFVVPRVAAEHAATAAWMSVPLNALEALLLIWLYLDAFDKDFSGGLVEQFERQAGWVGTLTCTVLALDFFVITGLLLRRFGGETQAALLLRTPITVVEAGMLLALSYGVYSGLETLARVVMLLALPLGLTFVTLLAFTWRRFNPANLLPLFGYGFKPLLYWGLFAGWFRELVIVPVLWPYLRDRSKTMNIGLVAAGTSGLLMTITVLSVLMLYPFPTAPRFPFPVLELTRVIRMGAFISNVEAIFAFLFTLGILIKLALTFWMLAIITADLLHLPEYRPLVPVLALGVWMFGYLPHAMAEVSRWSELYVRGYASHVIYPLNLLVWGIARLKRMRRGAHA